MSIINIQIVIYSYVFFLCVCVLFGSEVMDKTTARGSDPVDVARAVLKAVCHKQKDVVLAGLLPTAAVYLRHTVARSLLQTDGFHAP